MKTSHKALLAATGAMAVAACETTEEAVCRVPTAYERTVFATIVMGDEAGLATYVEPHHAELAERIEDLDPALAQQLFGYRFGDAAVKTVLIQPPLCVIDEQVSRDVRISYIFPDERYPAIQNLERPGFERGRSGIDHAACRFERVDGSWQIVDACLTTFGAYEPPEPEEDEVAEVDVVEEAAPSEDTASEAETLAEEIAEEINDALPSEDNADGDDIPAPVVEPAGESDDEAEEPSSE